MSGFEELDPPRFNYIDAQTVSAEQMAVDNVSLYIKLLQGRINKALVALDQGMPAHEVVRILQG